ncbi:MAG: PASTA domain-containing protein [Candidatus Electryonea clarkiae]|nr:PASTA domain-containing protein [Candidatus Electryonea clarkiae]
MKFRVVNVFDWIGRIAIVMVVWVIFAAIAHFVVLPIMVRKGQEVKVPDMLNHQLAEAQATFGKQGFKIIVDDERFDAAAVEGIILDQHPKPGNPTKKGRRIHVAVSAGPPVTTVPDVIGMTKDDAVFALQRARLTVEDVQYIFSKYAYEGKVVSQNPSAGEQTGRDDNATIMISLGKEPTVFKVPEVAGLPFKQARYLILRAGLKVGSVKYDDYVKHVGGAVVMQKPDSGTDVENGSFVDLIVNR